MEGLRGGFFISARFELGPELWRWVLGKLWQRVGNLEPRRLGGHVDVNNGSDDRFVVERSGGDDDVCTFLLEYRHIGAADLAERSNVAW